jgi:PKD repeat protein
MVQYQIFRAPVHTFTPSSQVYTVKIKTTSSLVCGYVERSRFVKPSGLITNAEFEFVNKCDSGYIRFVNKSSLLTDPSVRFSWDFGDGSFSNLTDPIHVYNASGIYNVKLKLKAGTGCLDDSITHPVDITRVTLSLPPSQTILIGKTVQLNVSGGGKYCHLVSSYWIK